MTRTLSVSAARPRWRSIIATLGLVAALVATSSAVTANAVVVGSGPGTVSGTVTTEGQPVEGAFVSVSISFGQATIFHESTTTDAAGHYEFTGLELDTYAVQAFIFGAPQPPSQSAVLTAESPAVTADFVIEAYAVGDGTLSGYVTADGVPLANHSVTAYAGPSGQNLYGFTDENGRYQFDGLGYGTWSVTSWAGPQYQYLNTPSVQLTETAPAATIDIAFLSWPVGTASISGVLTDSVTGEPIPGINVNLGGIDVAHVSNATSDEAGAYSFDLLPEGKFSLSIWAPGYLSTFVQPIEALSDEPVTLDIALVATTSTISGHIVGPGGVPAVGLGVMATTADGSNGSYAMTDENGDYVITDVAAVPYTLSVGGQGTPYKLKERVVTPVANGNIVANFKLKDRKTGTFGGIVLAPDGQWYNQPVCVTLYSSKNKNALDELVTLGPDSGDGTYYFANVKPGSYTVKFEDCDDEPATKFDPVFLGGAKKYKDATFVTIAAAEDSITNDFTLTYRAPNSTISGHVAKPNGTPIVGLTVHASGDDSSADAVTNANGDYVIAGLYNGEYEVSAGGAGTLYVHKQKSVTVDEGGSATLNFSLAKR